jgi:hydroxymethylglutaryl-CoA lyase
MSVSETHNLGNLRMTREQSFAQLAGVIALAKQAGVPVNVSLSCVFGCPMEGEVAGDGVRGWIDRFAALQVQGVTLCDTTGMATRRRCNHLRGRDRHGPSPGLDGALPQHARHGAGNTVAAVEAGIRRLDMSLGGIGGCPYAPGATGNVATEDVVHMLQCMGYDTGMDLDGLIAAAAELQSLVRHDLPGQVSRAGHRLTRHAPPADFDDTLARARAREPQRQKEPHP